MWHTGNFRWNLSILRISIGPNAADLVVNPLRVIRRRLFTGIDCFVRFACIASRARWAPVEPGVKGRGIQEAFVRSPQGRGASLADGRDLPGRVGGGARHGTKTRDLAGALDPGGRVRMPLTE